MDTIVKQGMDVLFADMTPEGTALSALPYKVARAFVPGMVPMHFGYGQDSVGLERVRTLPVKASVLQKERGEHSLNCFPHPFT